jgi:hypothetical protein
MYLISEIYKKWVNWWRFYCRVWYIKNWNLSDVTDQIAKRFDYDLDKKTRTIKIHFGSWTWASRITQSLQYKDWVPLEGVDVRDVSCFN